MRISDWSSDVCSSDLALREERARAALSEAGRVTDAIYDAGFSGPSRFYDNMEGSMGMTASAWVNGGQGSTIHWAVVPTSLGAKLVAATDQGVCRLSFAEGREALEERTQLGRAPGWTPVPTP